MDLTHDYPLLHEEALEASRREMMVEAKKEMQSCWKSIWRVSRVFWWGLHILQYPCILAGRAPKLGSMCPRKFLNAPWGVHTPLKRYEGWYVWVLSWRGWAPMVFIRFSKVVETPTDMRGDWSWRRDMLGVCHALYFSVCLEVCIISSSKCWCANSARRTKKDCCGRPFERHIATFYGSWSVCSKISKVFSDCHSPVPPLCGFGGHFVSPSRGPPFAEFHFLNFTNAEYIKVPWNKELGCWGLRALTWKRLSQGDPEK